MADIIDFSARPSADHPRPEGGMAEVVGSIGGVAGERDGVHEYPVPQAGQVVRLVYPAGASVAAELPAECAALAVELTTHADGHADLKVTVPAADVTPIAREARTAMARTVGLDARDLSAMEQLRSALGQQAIDNFVASYVQRHFLQFALRRTGVVTFLAPELPPAEPPTEGADYTFAAKLLLKPKVSLTSYDPVEVEFPKKAEVSSKDVSAYLDQLAEQMATLEEDRTRREAKDGDFVTISLESSQDGQPFPALTRRSMAYQIGSGLLPEEFDRQLTGMAPRARSEFSASIPMPDDEGNLTYAVVQVKLTLEHVDRKVPAVINDAWVMQNAPQAGTLLGLRGQIRDALEREADAAYYSELAARCSEELAKRLVPELSEAYAERMRAQLLDQFALELANQGIDLQMYMAQPGFDLPAFQTRMARQAALELHQSLALSALAEHLGLEADQASLDAVLATMAPGRERQAQRELTENGQIEQVREMALRAKASEWLVQHAKDAGGPKLQLL